MSQQSTQLNTTRRRGAVLADAALLLVTMAWGATFVVVKEALAEIRPFAFLAVRFGIAALLLAPWYWRGIVRGGLRQARAGLFIGGFLFLGYGAQTLGLQWTSAGKAGFITGLMVVFVPVFSAWLLRQPPRRDSVLGVLLATLGLALLTLTDSLQPNRGDALVLLCAVCFAMHIISVGKHARHPDNSAGALATIQIGVTSLLALAASLATERGYWAAIGGPGGIPPAAWRAILITAVFATAAAFLIQNLAQRRTTPTHTAVVFSMEPVFAALFAWLLAGEVLGPRGVAGGALIVVGMLAAELEPLAGLAARWSRRPRRRRISH